MAVILEELQEGDMNTIGPVYPAHIAVSQAKARLVADETANASTSTIRSDQQRVKAAQEVETAEAKTSNLDFVT
jgi:hypothetical protein